MSKKYFITFGAGKNYYYEAVNRLCNQAIKTELFDVIKGITDNDLRNDISFWEKHGNFIENNPRGFGYWLWKSYIILNQLEKMNYGDILVYCDSGDEINYYAKEEFKKIIDSINEHQFIGTNSGCTIKNWVKRDLLIALNMDNDTILYEMQHQSGASMYLKNDTIMKFVKEWYNLCENYHNIDDSPSIACNYSEFIEHRHDQAVFDLLTLKYNLRNTDIDPSLYTSNDYNVIKNRPVITGRNRSGISVYKELQCDILVSYIENTLVPAIEENTIAMEALKVTIDVEAIEDTIDTESVEDTIASEAVEVTISMEGGEDTIATESVEETVVPTEDTIAVEALEVTISMEDAEDTIAVESLEDTIATESAEDTIASEAVEDTIAVESLEDTIATESV